MMLNEHLDFSKLDKLSLEELIKIRNSYIEDIHKYEDGIPLDMPLIDDDFIYPFLNNYLMDITQLILKKREKICIEKMYERYKKSE